MTLTDAEREALHHAVLWDVMHPKESVPTVHAAAERIVAAHVAEALAPVETLAGDMEMHADGWTCQSCGADNFAPHGFVDALRAAAQEDR